MSLKATLVQVVHASARTDTFLGARHRRLRARLGPQKAAVHQGLAPDDDEWAFESWGKLFGDDVIASAILDRLLHQSHVFSINGPSYRLKDRLHDLTDEPATR